MKWTYLIGQKMKVALAFGIVFILVFATLAIDKRHINTLQESFSSVYADRLLVEGYIYKLSGLFHSKKIIFNFQNIAAADISENNKEMNDSIRHLLVDYEKTKFTRDETMYFNQLKEDFQKLVKLEDDFLQSDSNSIDVHNAIQMQHIKLSESLNQLSDIQMKEGKNLMDNTKKIVAASKITYRLEIAILLIIGLIIQGLIFASRSMVPKFKQKSHLN